MTIREQLNGLGPMADAVRMALANQRRDLRADVATMQAEVRGSLLELERVISLAREKIAAVKDGVPGLDGKDGAPGLPGERGEKGDPGEAGAFVPPERHEPGKIYFRGQLVYHEGSTYCALAPTAQTPPHEQWQPVAHCGSSGRALGLYNADTAYAALDVVSFNGCEWRAVKDRPGALPGDDWVLGAKGVKGKPGERGEKGERGEPGVSIESATALEGYMLDVRFTNGANLLVDVSQWFREFAAELDAQR